MTQIPTTSDIQQLGARLAADGFGSHESEVRDLVRLAGTVAPQSAALEVLGDPSAPENARSRAFSKLAADWDRLSLELVDRADRFDRSLAQLLEAWNAHEELRSSGAPVSELFASRIRLNAQRSLARGQTPLHLGVASGTPSAATGLDPCCI